MKLMAQKTRRVVLSRECSAGRQLVVECVTGVLLLAFVAAPDALAGNRKPKAAPARTTSATSQRVLSEYPVLCQLDYAIYASRDYADSKDDTGNGGTTAIRNLTCLATCYLMIDRANVYPSAVISEGKYYKKGTGALPPVSGKIGADQAFAADTIVREINNGNPVVIKAKGGKLGTHFVLAVGYRSAGAIIIVNDPWNGKQAEMPASGASVMLPGYSDDMKVSSMRLVKVIRSCTR